MTGNHKTELNHILDKILNLHTNVYSETEEYKILQQKFSIDSFDVTNRDQPRLAIDNHLIQIKKQVAEIEVVPKNWTGC